MDGKLLRAVQSDQISRVGTEEFGNVLRVIRYQGWKIFSLN